MDLIQRAQELIKLKRILIRQPLTNKRLLNKFNLELREIYKRSKGGRYGT